MAAEYSIKQGDLLPVIEGTLRNPDGTPMSLTDCTVFFRMRRKGLTLGELIIDDVEAEIVDEASGRVRYVWLDGDTTSPGYFAGEWIVHDPLDQPMTTPTLGYIDIIIERNLTTGDDA